MILKSNESSTRRIKRLAGWVVLALVLVSAGFSLVTVPPLAGASDPVERATPALPVAIVRVAMVDRFVTRDRLAGRVVSRRRSDLGFDRSGRIDRVFVEEGVRVEAGQVLAQLDTRELEAARREQKARIGATQAQLDLARVTAQRQRELARSEYLSPQALDEALSHESNLEAGLVAERAALERTDVAIELSRLRVPYDAVVARRYLDEGSIVNAGQIAISILELSAPEVHLGVPPELAGELVPGSRHVVEGGPGPMRATLRTILPELDARTRTLTAILDIDIDPSAESLPPLPSEGSLVWVRVERSVEEPGVWVPIGALAEGRRGTWTAFAVVSDANGIDRIERRQVEIVQTEEDRVYVRGTIRAGDRLVRDGLHRLVPGVRVSVIDDTLDAKALAPSHSNRS